MNGEEKLKNNVWKILTVIILAVAVILVMRLKNQANPPANDNPEVSLNQNAPENSGLPRFLELGSDKCVPCKMMQPVIAELSRECAGKLRVDFIDVWKNPDEGKKYQVRAIPTQIFFDREGREIFRHIGFFPKPEIYDKFRELGIKL